MTFSSKHFKNSIGVFQKFSFQTTQQVSLTIFREMAEEMKIQTLIIEYEKIAIRFSKKKWIFKCCRNYCVIEEIYEQFIEMMISIHSFAALVFNNCEIESHPPCYGKKASVRLLDFLVTDFEIMIDVFYRGLSSFEIRGNEKLIVVLELCTAINGLLSAFERKYS